MSLRPDQIERYARHIMLREIGGPGQAKLLASRVAIVGAGALGGPCAMYLAAAGVGRITLYDDDVVSLSNLQRQVQFTTADVGKRKVDVLAGRLRATNPDVEVVAHAARFGEDTSPDADVLIDASDNFPTRFAVNAVSLRTGLPLISGAVGRWTGQVGLLNAAREVACYGCFVPETPPNAETCAEIGVVGALTGVIGTRMALDTLKLIAGQESARDSCLWIFDGWTGQARQVRVQKDTQCLHCSRFGA